MRHLLLTLLLLPLLGWSQDTLDAPRPWRHEIGLRLGVGIAPDVTSVVCGIVSCEEVTEPGPRVVGTAVAYRYLRPVDRSGRLWLGGGGEFEWMGTGDGLRNASLTGLVEYRLGSGRILPTVRLEAGAGLPIGSREWSLGDRSVGRVFYPAVGLLKPSNSRRGNDLQLMLGYRFIRQRLATPFPYGGSWEQRLSYRRLTLTLATRF